MSMSDWVLCVKKDPELPRLLGRLPFTAVGELKLIFSIKMYVTDVVPLLALAFHFKNENKKFEFPNITST
jgi:hypothetical protein